jgi:hypothetical protein
MIEARVIKSQVVVKNAVTYLLGVAEYEDELVNFKLPFMWEVMDTDEFINDLRDKLAEEFDIPVYHVDVRADALLKKMEEGTFRADLMGYREVRH